MMGGVKFLTSDGCTGKFAREDVPADSHLFIELELVSWKEVIEVTKDRGVLKKTLVDVQGEYKKPNEGAKVTGTLLYHLFL